MVFFPNFRIFGWISYKKVVITPDPVVKLWALTLIWEITICLTGRHRQFFWHYFVSLVKFSYCSKFNVNIITGCGVMISIFYKGLTRNPEIRNTLVWISPNILKPGRVRDTRFGNNVSNEMLLNTAKCQGYSLYGFWVIKGKPTVGE